MRAFASAVAGLVVRGPRRAVEILVVLISASIAISGCIGDEGATEVETSRAALTDPPWVKATKALDKLRTAHRTRMAQSLASLSSAERTRRFNHFIWRGINPAEIEVRRNVFGAVGSITGPFLRLPHTDQTPKTKVLDAAQEFMARYGRDPFGAETTDVLSIDTTSPGLVHGAPGAVAFRQLYKGIPIIAAEAEVFLDRQLKVYAAGGTVVPGFTVNTTPSVPKSAALTKAAQAAQTETGQTCQGATATLAGWNRAFAGEPDEDRLVWRVSVNCSAALKRTILVDAHNSSVRLSHDPIRLYGEDVEGKVTDMFVRWNGETEHCFAPEHNQCLSSQAGRTVFEDGACTWSYNFVDGVPEEGGQVAGVGHPANCDQVPETDQIIRALDVMTDFVDAQPWLTEDDVPYTVPDLVNCLGSNGFCVQIDTGSGVFGDLPTIGKADGSNIILRPDVAAPDVVGHELMHVFQATLGVETSTEVREHLADIGGVIATNRALEEQYGLAYEAPDPWVDQGTTTEADVQAKQLVRDDDRPCSQIEHPLDAPPGLITDLEPGDPRIPDPNWRSVDAPGRSNRGHCSGPTSFNGEWQSGDEAYAQYFIAGADDSAVPASSAALSHTNLGIGNRMLQLYTEGGSYRGFRPAARGFTDLEQTLFGALTVDMLHLGELDAGWDVGWPQWTARLMHAACILDEELPFGDGCADDLNDRADSLIDAAGAVSIWTEPEELTDTRASVGHPMAAVSYVADGAAERVYVFYRGSEDLDDNSAIHYRWLDVSSSRYLGTPLVDGSWHPTNGDCTIPGSASATGPTAIARQDSVWVSWVEDTAGGPLVRGRSFSDIPNDANSCIAANAWSAVMSPAIQDEEIFPTFFDGALDVEGPVALVEVPLVPPGNPLERFARCVNMQAPAALDPFPFSALDPPSVGEWTCTLYPENRNFFPGEYAEVGNFIQDGLNPAAVRVTVPYATDPEAPAREDAAIGSRVTVTPAPYAAVSSSYRSEFTSGALFGANFTDAFDGSGLTQGISVGAEIDVVQDLVPYSGGPRLSYLREIHIGFPENAVFLVWRDSSGQVWMHPWDLIASHQPLSQAQCAAQGGVYRNGECLLDILEPSAVMESSVAPAATSHRYRNALFDTRHGIYVFGADDDGAVIAAHSTNASGTLEGVMEFGDPQVLTTMPDPAFDPADPTHQPRPPFYRAWTDRPLAVWSRPARANRSGMLNFVLFPLRPDDPGLANDPFFLMLDARLGFRSVSSPFGKLLGGVVDTDEASGDIEFRLAERLFSISDTSASDSVLDELPALYRPSPGAGVATRRDVVLIFDAAHQREDGASAIADVNVRSKLGE